MFLTHDQAWVSGILTGPKWDSINKHERGRFFNRTVTQIFGYYFSGIRIKIKKKNCTIKVTIQYLTHFYESEAACLTALYCKHRVHY